MPQEKRMQAKLSVRTIDNTSFFKYYDGKSFLVYFLYPSLVLHWRTLEENIQQLSMNLRNAFFASFIELILNNLVVFLSLTTTNANFIGIFGIYGRTKVF